jgi:hypothetical protein
MSGVKNQNTGKPHEPVIIPEPKIPIPLECRYGGLGDKIEPLNQALLIGNGEKFIPLASPGHPNRFLQTTKEGLAWSKFELELLGDAKLDQSLHKGAAPIFNSIGVHCVSEGTSWLKRENSKRDYTIRLNSDCLIDQDLSRKSKVNFEAVSANNIDVDFVRLTPTKLKADEAGAGTIAMTKDGACLSNGLRWMSLHGNLHGEGKQNRLAYFTDETSVKSCITLQYTDDGQLGIGVDDPLAMLHVKEEVIFESGARLGELSEKSTAGCFGLVDGRPGFRHANGFMEFGTGNGNLIGKGKKGYLAFFADDEILTSGEISLSDKGALVGSHFIADMMTAHEVTLLGDKHEDVKLYAKDGKVCANGSYLGFAFERGALECDFGEIKGAGKLADGSLSIKANRASAEIKGIASFDSSYFSVDNGHVKIAWQNAPHAKDGFGLISDRDFNEFSNKAESFNVGNFREGTGISIEGAGKAFHSDVRISVHEGTHKNAGIICLCEEDFEFRGGVACLRHPQLTEYTLNKILEFKQDTLPLNVATFNQGFDTNYKMGIIGTNPVEVNLATATYEKMGIASYNEKHFKISDGRIYIKETPIATHEVNGLMAKEHVQLLAQVADLVNRCPEGSGTEGTLAIWTKDGLATASDFETTNGGIRYTKTFNAKNIRSEGVVVLGTTEAKAEQVGGGALRFEKGCLEVSNGQQWITLRAGGLIGEGRLGSLAFWSSENALTAPESLNWDEEHSRLGLGTVKPLASIHIEKAGASLMVVDTRPSSPQNGAYAFLGSDDGLPLGMGDVLGNLSFGSLKAVGASIKAYAATNWSKTSAASCLAFGTTPDGQISPVDHLFLTQDGFMGLDIANPTAPLHIASENKHGMTAIFKGGIKIGASDASASIAGMGAMKIESGNLLLSDGISWRRLSYDV